MTDQFHEGEQVAEQSVIEVSEKGVNVPNVPAQPQTSEAPTAIPDDHFFGVNKPKMEKLMDDITTLEKTVETAAVRNMDDVYRTTLNKVQLMMGSGSLTLTEAIDLATREFLDKGINCIVYADGRRVNIADYVRMALRTTSTRATLQGAAKRFAELGYDTVLISQYGGCSETCEPYQGKVYIDDVFTLWSGQISGDFGKSNYCDKWFMLLSVAIRGGLFHPNCRHTMGQYIDGLTKIPKPIPAEKIQKQRMLEEKQRQMERKIRALKRKVEGTQDEKKVKEYKRKLREEQGKLREFIKEHDDVLRRDYSREKIYSGEGKPKQEAPRTEEAPVKATDTESKNPVPTDKEPNIPQPDNNISEPEKNENTMNFVQPEPLKTIQSEEETDDTPTAVMTDEAVETAETTENVQETAKQPVEATADSEEDVQNFTDDTVDNSDESVNENVELPASDVHIIGKLDVETYSCVTEDIITDDVIITDKQIEHIKERHPDDFERFSQYFEEIIKHPDYIIEANKPNTALILKEIKINNERFKTILRLVTSQDNPAYKNSIITFMKINEKDWKRILKNKKILYKSE